MWRRNGAVGSGGNRFISLFLVFCFCTQLIPGRVIAEGNTDNLLVGEQGKLTIQVDGRDMTLVATATATEGSDMADVDADKDGLSAMEETAYGSDDNNKDTDGDSLNDFQEVYMFLTDPTNADSDGNGIPDGREDVDGDGLVNLDELSRGTNPVQRDTDGDGLDDGNEVGRGTDPLKADTDGDGMLDGFEIEHGFDPKVFNGSVDISNQYDKASSSVIAKVVVRGVTGAQAQSLSVSEIPSDDILLGDHVPGWIGNAYEINMDNSSGGLDATLTMTYYRSLVGPDFEPEICLFDEENQSLDPVPNQTDDQNGTVTAPLTHFSVYILRNKKNKAVKASVNTIQLPDFQNGVAVLLDCEPSPSQESNAIWQTLSIKFPEKIKGFLGDQKAVLYHEIDNRYQGLETITYQNLNDYLEYWVSNTAKKVFYLVSSNVKKQLTSEQAQQIANLANGKVINFVLAVKDQNYSNDDVKGDIELASLTQGNCYLVTDADSFLSSLDSAHPSYSVDSNGDGLTDGDTWDIVNWNVLSDLYGNVFSGYNYTDFTDFGVNADLDNDGLKNGEEIKVENGKVVVTSLPTLKDSDYDGIEDKYEQDRKGRLQAYSIYPWKDSGLPGSFNAKLYMNYRWFAGDPTKFIHSLANTSAIMASLSYLDDRNQLNGKTRFAACRENLGLENVQGIEVKSLRYHNAHATVGHHEFDYEGKRHMVLFVGVTGYLDSGWEWVSNFTVGNPSEAELWYADGWRDSQNHLGFDIPANLLLDRVKNYLNTTNMKKIVEGVNAVHVWTVGHSRGAAVSNLFASKVVDGGLESALPSNVSCNVFAYDFATPRGTTKTSHNAAKYNCIFNIINNADPVPMLPLSGWNFYQYGRIYRFDLHENKDISANLELYGLVKDNYGDVKDAEHVMGKMTELFPHQFRYNMDHIGIYNEYAAISDFVNIVVFYKEFLSVSENRAGLYRFKTVIDATEGSVKDRIIKRGEIELISYKERIRIPAFTIPDCKPRDAQKYINTHWDSSEPYFALDITPEFMMTLLGYAAGQIIGPGNPLPLFEFIGYSSQLSYLNALAGFARMAYGSGLLAAHIDSAYYLGSYLCKESSVYSSLPHGDISGGGHRF